MRDPVKDVSSSKLIKREQIFVENESVSDYDSGTCSELNSIEDSNDSLIDDEEKIVNIEK